jgi:ribosomal protein S1
MDISPEDMSADVNSKKIELEGLIHISELDWQLIENPAEVVKIGEKVKAKIIDISNNKISLSLKALKKDPWIEIEKYYRQRKCNKFNDIKLNPYPCNFPHHLIAQWWTRNELSN